MIIKPALKEHVRDRLEIFQSRPYRLYFIAMFISIIGTGMQFIANGWLALEMTNSNYSVALILVADTLPGIILQPFIGFVVDRIDRKVLLTLMDLFRMVVVMSVPFLWWLGWLHPVHLYIMAFVIAIGDKIFTPASIGLIREIISEDRLLNVNATTSIATQVGSLLGAAVGGILITAFSPIIVMVLNSFTFLVSAILIWNIRKEYYPPQQSDLHGNIWQKFTGDIRLGMDYIGEHSYIVPPYIVMLLFIATFRTLSMLVAPFSRTVLEAGAEGFGYLDAAFAGGAIVGNFILPSMTGLYKNKQYVGVYGMFALAISIVLFAISPNLWVAIIAYFFIGVSFQVRVFYMTFIQSITDVDFQGRVYAAFGIPIGITSVVVLLVMGYVSEIFSMRWLYLIQAIVVVFMAIYANVKMLDTRYDL